MICLKVGERHHQRTLSFCSFRCADGHCLHEVEKTKDLLLSLEELRERPLLSLMLLLQCIQFVIVVSGNFQCTLALHSKYRRVEVLISERRKDGGLHQRNHDRFHQKKHDVLWCATSISVRSTTLSRIYSSLLGDII